MFKKPRLMALFAIALLFVLSGCVAPEITTSSAKERAARVTSLDHSLIPYTIDATITLSGKRTDAKGGGVSFVENEILITEGGNYCIEGTLDDGQIRVFAPNENVTLILNGADINAGELAPIYVETASSVEIYLPDSTVNTVVCSNISNYEKELEATQESSSDKYAAYQRAAIMSECSLMIRGSGTLNVSGYLNNGIQSKATIEMSDVDLKLMAADNGIKASTSVIVESGTYDIVSVGDAIQAGENFIARGGTFAITTGEGSASVEKKTEEFPGMGGDMQGPPDFAGFGGSGDFPGPPDAANAPTPPDFANFQVEPSGADFDTPVAPADIPGEYATKSSDNGTPSQKAIKAKKNIVLVDGSFDLDTADDAIHCDGNVRIHGGSYTISSGDDSIHADDNLTITDGEITILDCYEGFEAAMIDIKGGDINITSADDGINASSDEIDALISISGGILYIDSTGDGIDSNKDIVISGGEIYVDGPSSAFNSSIDVGSETGGKFLLNGGTVTSIGSSGMLEVPDESSEQQSITFVFETTLGSGSVVTIVDSNKAEIATLTLVKAADSILYSSPRLKAGETYTFKASELRGSITTDCINATNYEPHMGPGQ